MRLKPFILSSALLLLPPVISPSVTLAQSAPLESTQLALGIDSGDVEASKTSRGPTVVFSTEIGGDGEPWIRLHFQDVELAGSPSTDDGSYLRLTSQLDGAQQTLDGDELPIWQYSSAYFNGDKVLVELLAYPGTGTNHVTIDHATVGGMDPTPQSICGEGDDRVPSGDPRSGRLLPIGCTAFLVDEGQCSNRFLTAGHCLGASDSPVVQFNVPPSRPNGTLVHPSPQDQYPVDPGSIQSSANGPGEDYGTFVVGPNSETGLTPRAAQGAAFHLADSVSSDPGEYWLGVQVTGYGLDQGTASQTLQTDSGPLLAKTGPKLDYFLDTQGGNSGSPVINRRDDSLIGVHTHGGCTVPSIGANSGTSIDNSGLVSMLDNGPMGACEEHKFCEPDAYWYFDGADGWEDAEPIDAWFDGANCYVHHLEPTDGEPFIHDNRAYYVTPGPNGVCEQGWFDGANCLLGYAPEWRTPFFFNGAFYYIE